MRLRHKATYDAARLRAAAHHVEEHSRRRVLEAPGVHRMVPARKRTDA